MNEARRQQLLAQINEWLAEADRAHTPDEVAAAEAALRVAPERAAPVIQPQLDLKAA